jgi:flagellar hook-associated protein 1
VATNGSESIYTDSGVTLFQDTPRTVSFTPTPTLVDGMNGGAVTVDGVPITGANSPMPIQSGALAGYAALRDTLAPEYQAQLDQIAGGLINTFAESDQSAAPTLPSLPGLFTTPGATSLPLMSATTGLGAAIEVNPNVDPSQGGNPNLLRDGGISDPGNPAYTYNATGAASYTGRIQQLLGQIVATQSFDPSAGLDSSANLTDYANASVSWLQAENQQASDASSYQNALATQANSALSNATGVNLDAEMTNMLNLENSYASTAKLLTTVNSMFSSLLQAA